MKLKNKNSNGDKTQKLKLWQNSKTQIVTNSKTQIGTELELGQNPKSKERKKLKTQNVTKFKLWQNSRIKIWWNSKLSIVTKLKNSSCDKNFRMTNINLLRNKKKYLKEYFSKNILTPWQ